MLPTVDLGSEDWSGAGEKTFYLRGLVKDYDGDAYLIDTLIIKAALDLTTGVGGGCTTREIMEWFSSIFFKTKVHNWCPGANAYQVQLINENQLDAGFSGRPSDLAASQTNSKRNVTIVFKFARRVLKDGREFATQVALIKDGYIKVKMGASDGINSDTTVNSCNLKMYGKIRRGKADADAYWTINAVDVKLYDTLPDAVYEGLIVVPATVFALADFTNIHVVAGGEDVWGGVGPDAVIASFLDSAPTGSLGGNDYSNDYASLDFFPLIFNDTYPQMNPISGCVDTMGDDLILDCDGGLSSICVVFRRFEENTDVQIDKSVKALGGDPRGANVVALGLKGNAIAEGARKRVPGVRALPRRLVSFRNADMAGDYLKSLDSVGVSK